MCNWAVKAHSDFESTEKHNETSKISGKTINPNRYLTLCTHTHGVRTYLNVKTHCTTSLW